MEAKRKIKLEIIFRDKKVFEAVGKCDTIYFDGHTKICWKKQNPDMENFRIRLENSTLTLDESYNLIFLASNSKSFSDTGYEIKTTIGRRT